MSTKEIVEAIRNMSILEIKELADALYEALCAKETSRLS